ncbi:MAG: serine hydrolase, partial [Pedobacter sp.]|uniref:serine hydrolase n=1 Tax=Pedobacter sp. TaxID=1411316 RepID=UPI0035655F04
MKKILFFISFLIHFQMMAQQPDTVFLQKLLLAKPELFNGILNHPTKNEVQVMYTQVNRDKNNKPTFTSYSYNLDPKRYFYPASTVKLAAVIFALEKVNELKSKGLHSNLTMLTDSSFKGQTKVTKDESAQNGKPTIAHYVKKILLTSDNDAFNRLFEFIGIAEINSKLKKYGLVESRILNRLAIG